MVGTMSETQTYLLRDIPLSLWAKVRAKATLERETVKDVILQLLRQYVG
jgi:hypothetical protein